MNLTNRDKQILIKLVMFVVSLLFIMGAIVYQSDASEFESHGECVAHFMFGNDYCRSSCDIHNPYNYSDRVKCWHKCDDDFNKSYKQFCEKLK